MRVAFEVDGIEVSQSEGLRKMLMAIGFIIEGSIVEKIRQLGLVKTGRFMDSIHSYMEGDTLVISDNVEYGKYLEFGTTEHFVRPTKKKALHWKKGGKDFFSKGHKVSGIKVYAPFRRGFKSALPKIERFFN